MKNVPSRLEALGYTTRDCDPSWFIDQLEDLSKRDQTERTRQTGVRRELSISHSRWTVLYYVVHGELDEAHTWAQRMLNVAENYFFGAWRDEIPSGNFGDEPPSREYQDQTAWWATDLDVTMLCAAVLERWDEFGRFATYLRDDVIVNVDETEAHRAWWLYFCGIVRGRAPSEIEPFRQTVLGQSRKTEKLLLAWLDAIVGGADDELQAAVDAYFRHHRRVEAKAIGLNRRLAVRGTMLLHYGKHRGRSASIPEFAQLYLVDF